MFEITDVACNKGESVAWLAGYYGIAEDEVAVYGDGGNDIAMLKRFRHSYATKNASDAAKPSRARPLAAAWPTPFPNTCSPPCASKTPAPSSNNVTKGQPLCHRGLCAWNTNIYSYI